ncbi:MULTISPECIES: TetR/AcrR family transcriptional regulator [unclassified Azospirillum]|uniref:TetR/AcrR family transcriptional regulator n=1 Tax=unclassified Azospirillum TaxID=2630922 RepID=UPI000B6C5E99|nr:MULTISPECIES: TetR/AcrR family transcriptional regulator [unclassified Azospirillum]SNS61044.1 transcriptional regulator, TetR family [Azospirillum sp. RU38E]SNS80378.1 transcriptional regulator, TetR family [Azospirillum sp. RU37A]
MVEVAATRRSQPERREEMRRRLVAATLDALADHGHAGASLSVILDKAGVSRGAWAHHFDTKAEMLALAAEGLLREAVASAGTLSPAILPPGDGPAALGALLEQAWARFYEGRHRDLLFEVALAARTDAELKQRLAPIFSDFITAVGQSWGLALRPRPGAGAALADLMVLTVYMLRGMAMQELAAGPSPDHARLRALWAGLLAAQISC